MWSDRVRRAEYVSEDEHRTKNLKESTSEESKTTDWRRHAFL